ncbi:MAG: STAS domain-containing protein [Planctomycetota bacterium]
MGNVSYESRDDRLIVRFVGSFRPADADDFDQEIEQISGKGPDVVVLDLEKLDFIGSAGVGALLRLEKALTSNEKRVRIARASDQLQQVFRQSRLEHRFPFFDTLEHALA